MIEGWTWTEVGVALGVWGALAVLSVAFAGRQLRLRVAASCTVTGVGPVPAPTRRVSTAVVARSLAERSLLRILRIPAAIIPTVAMPVFLLISFSGAFTAVTDIPGFPTDSSLSWVAPYAIIQGASFAGVGASQAVAADLENGFYDRLLMAPGARIGLLLGPLTAAVLRVFLPFAVVLAVARVGGLVQVGVFVAQFLSIGQVPLSVMAGWLHTVARVNPMTNILRMARQGFVDEITWADTWPGLLVILVGSLLFGAWAHRGLRRLTD